MPRIRELGVWWHGEHVAMLRAPGPGRVTCTYTPRVVKAHSAGTPLLSCSLPLRTGRQNAWAFVNGLLPEGHHRQIMAAMAGVTTMDLLGMLQRFGRDVAGALVISDHAPDDSVRPSARAVPYQSSELETAIIDLGDHPLGLYDDSELSIAGVQDKMLLVRLPDGAWARPAHGYPSTHILKVDDRVHGGLVRAEHACLALATASGLDAAPSELIAIGSAECIIVERFDRTPAPDGPPLRIHQEDACQALGVDTDAAGRRAKYQAHGGPSLQQIAQLLTTWSTDPAAGRHSGGSRP